MSRLPPAFGLGRGPVQQAGPSQQQQAFEADTGFVPDKLTLTSRDAIDATLQGGSLNAAIIFAWHPTLPILAVATTAAIAEYDAISGCRRNLVDVVGTPLRISYNATGTMLVLLSKERVITAWSTSTWRRKIILPQDPKYVKRPLVAGLLAISAGPQPIVYYSPIGKMTLRTIQTALPTVAKGQKLDRELMPGFKLKTDNKKPIVGLASHPTEPQTVFLLLVDGTFMSASTSGGALTALCQVKVPFDPTRERVQLHSLPVAGRPGAALVMVEAEKSGVTLLDMGSRSDARVISTLMMGAPVCGSGYLSNSSIVVLAGRHAGGNVGVRAWHLFRDSREVATVKSAVMPGTLWDAIHGANGASGSSLSDVSGEAIIAGMLAHGPTGLLAFRTARRDEQGVAHMRLPLLQVLDSHMGVPSTVPLHTGLSFWTAADGEDGVVSKLRFPRYTHLISGGRVCAYDLTHGLVTEFLKLPGLSRHGQERQMVKVVKSAKQGVWVAFTEILADKEGATLGVGQYEASIVLESEAAVTQGEKCLPGKDGAFVGGKDEVLALLSNSGTLIAAFETSKLSTPAGNKALYAASPKDGPAVALFPGPPTHIPAAPTPKPDAPEPKGDETDDEAEAALQEWEQKEAKRLEPPKQVLMVTVSDSLALVEMSPSSVSYSAAARSLPSKYTLKLRSSEVVVQVAWQSLLEPHSQYHLGVPGASAAIPCVAAVLTTERILILDNHLDVLVEAAVPGDVGSATSCLWIGPALVVNTASNQILQVGWDGAVTHLCSLLSGPSVALLGALADRLLLAMRQNVLSNTEVASRGFQPLPIMVVGWAGIAARGILPGGKPRARKELRTLLASYDASQLPVAVLQQLSSCGFPEIAAVAAARSESSEVTPVIKAVLAAASGDWKRVTDLVLMEVEAACGNGHSVPNNGSSAYVKAVALARTCERHGRFKEARQLFQAAGAWNELLALCVFQGDFMGLQAYARTGGRDVQLLAEQLLAVNENAFRGSTTGAYGGRPNIEDWNVEFKIDDDVNPADLYPQNDGNHSPGGSVVNDGEEERDTNIAVSGVGDDEDNLIGDELEFEVAPAGRLPYMEGSLAVTTAAAATGELPPVRRKSKPTSQSKSATPQTTPRGSKKTQQSPTTSAASTTEQGTTTTGKTKKKKGKDNKDSDDDEDEEGQPIPRLNLQSLEAYLGIPGAKVIRDIKTAKRVTTAGLASAPSVPGAPTTAAPVTPTGGFMGLDRTETEGSMDLVAALAAAAANAGRAGADDDRAAAAGGSSTGTPPTTTPKEGETAAQAAARAAFKSLAVDEDDFFSSDEESVRPDQSISDSQSQRSGGGIVGASSQRFMINIKSSEAGGSVKDGGDTALKSAAQALKLGALNIGAIGGAEKSTASTPLSARDQQHSPSNPLLDTGDSFGSADFGFPSLSGLPSIVPPPPAGPPKSPSSSMTSTQPAGAGGATTKETVAVAEAPGPSKDPFADIAGLGTLASKKAGGTGEELDYTTTHVDASSQPGITASVPLPPTPFGGEEPMRAQPPPMAPQSDLLAGWDEFEAMFGAGGDPFGGGSASTTLAATTTTSQQPQQRPTPATPPPAAKSQSATVAQTPPPAAPVITALEPFQPLSPSTKRRWETATTAFCAGQWDKAAEGLGKCVDTADDGRAEPVVNLYAASAMLRLAVKKPPPVAARLGRFAAALPLEGTAKATVFLFSAEANMAARNFGYAAEQLTWLVIQTTEGGGVPGLSMEALQQRLDVCDNGGGGDHDIPEDEDADSFAAIVSSCRSKEDIDDLIGNIG